MGTWSLSLIMIASGVLLNGSHVNPQSHVFVRAAKVRIGTKIVVLLQKL